MSPEEKWGKMRGFMREQIGFFKLLGIPRSVLKRGAGLPDRRTVKFKTGVLTASREADELTAALAKIFEHAGHSGLLQSHPSPLYGVLVEATENTSHHAYESQEDRFTVKRWWMTGAVDRTNRRLNIVVYDQGRSIPATLPKSKLYPWIKRGLQLLRPGLSDDDQSLDGARLRLAMSVPRSSTGLSHRGKGFPAFLNAVDSCRDGRLRIVSRRGEFVYQKGRKFLGKTLETPVMGTLVEWDLWL